MSCQFLFALFAGRHVLNWFAFRVHGISLAELLKTISDLTTERFHRLHHSLIGFSVTVVAVVPEIHPENCPVTGWLSTFFALFVDHDYPTKLHHRCDFINSTALV